MSNEENSVSSAALSGEHPKHDKSAFEHPDWAVRLSEGRKAFERTLNLPDANQHLTEGKWSGFTKGNALAWSWNLMQFEPSGCVEAFSTLRRKKAESGLVSHDIPVPHETYPATARLYEQLGVTASAYRDVREKLRHRTFCWSELAEIRGYDPNWGK